jgi:hypothetical protein
VGQALAAVSLNAMITPAGFVPRMPNLAHSAKTEEPGYFA